MIGYQEILHSSRGFQPRKVTSGARRPRPYQLNLSKQHAGAALRDGGLFPIYQCMLHAPILRGLYVKRQRKPVPIGGMASVVFGFANIYFNELFL